MPRRIMLQNFWMLKFMLYKWQPGQYKVKIERKPIFSFYLGFCHKLYEKISFNINFQNSKFSTFCY